MISFKSTNNSARRRALARLRVETGQTLAQFARQWGGVMVHDLISWTPPREPSGGPGNWQRQKQIGKKAVERDIRRVFFGPSGLKAILAEHPVVKSHPRLLVELTKYIDSGEFQKLETVLRKIGSNLQIISAPTREKHFAERRKGRVVKRPSHRYFVGSEGPIKGYIREIQQDVGKLKSGWMTAAAQAGLNPKDIPKWIRGHAEPGYGKSRLRGAIISIYVRNMAKAAKDQNPSKIVAPAMRMLEAKMMKSLQAIMRHKHGHH